MVTTDESMAVQEQTMVGSVEDEVEKGKVASPQENDVLEEKDIVTNSEPPRDPRLTSFSTNAKDAHDLTVVEGEYDVDSKGHPLFRETDTKASPVASRRGSHLRLDLKPPSPQPWELVEPPNEEDHKGASDYSIGRQKYQNTTQTRPLIPKSSYYFGPPPPDAAFGTHPIGQIGIHHPREIIRIERDYTGGELVQFAAIYPLELEGRITPTQFLESINAINELLISAHSLRHSVLDNALAVFSLQLSKLVSTSHYDKEMQRLEDLVAELNVKVYNPVGLHMLWPRDVAFLFLEIEYY